MQEAAALIERHRRPVPRLRVGALLGRTRSATACMDLSDGLADAVSQLAGQRHRAVIDAAALPIPAGPPLVRVAGRTTRCAPPSPAATTTSCCSRSPAPAAGCGRSSGRPGASPITRIGELTASPAILVKRDAATEPMPRRVHPLLIAAGRAMVRFPEPAWLEQLLHTHDTPQRTAAAFALGVFFGFSPLLGLHTDPRPDLRLRAEPEPGRGPARRLLQPPLDPGALLHARRRGSARPSSGLELPPGVPRPAGRPVENRSWTEFRTQLARR